MNAKLKLLKQLMQKTIDDIDAGNTTDDDESINAAIDVLSTLNNGIPRYSKRYLCDKVLHCSESCFNTYLSMGIIPDGYKEFLTACSEFSFVVHHSKFETRLFRGFPSM